VGNCVLEIKTNKTQFERKTHFCFNCFGKHFFAKHTTINSKTWETNICFVCWGQKIFKINKTTNKTNK